MISWVSSFLDALRAGAGVRERWLSWDRARFDADRPNPFESVAIFLCRSVTLGRGLAKEVCSESKRN